MRPLVRFPSRDVPTDDIRQRLRDLPSERQPPYDFTEFRRRAREQAWPKRSAVKWEHAAAAAGITVLIASMAMWGRSEHSHPQVAGSGVATAPINERRDSVPANDAGAASDTAKRPSVPSGAWTPELAEQINKEINAAVAAQVAALGAAPASRRWLAQQPAEPAVVRVGSRLAVANLEDRIAWVDDALSDADTGHADAAGLRALRLERARLVGSLAQVRYAETLAAQVN
jgi:hypothetical protein